MTPPVNTKLQLPVIGVVMATLEGGALCMQRINRDAAAQGRIAPAMVASCPPSNRANHLLELLNERRYEEVARFFSPMLSGVQSAGASFAVIPANTAHFAFEEIRRLSPIPLLNILDAVSDRCSALRCRRVGVLGTRATMSGNLYGGSLSARGIETVPVDEKSMSLVHGLIVDELIKGMFTQNSIDLIQAVIAKLQSDGADAVILGCTELPLLLQHTESSALLVDSTRVLAQAALDFACPNPKPLSHEESTHVIR